MAGRNVYHSSNRAAKSLCIFRLPWDMAAGVLMIREAGGRVTAFDADYSPFERSGVLAGNPVIYEALRNLLKGVA